MSNGIIIVDKPTDWTSHDVVARLRRHFGERRIGHAGTLDPMATGVLPIFVGRATRAVSFATEGDKEYLAGLRLGLVTDTQDITGNILQETPCAFTREQVEAVLGEFRGDLAQIPPMYSAIKQQGKKLYELARAGREVHRQPRPVTIHQLELLEQTSPTDFLLRVACSKGTYIRTLCHDIGARLGVGGCLYTLRRTRVSGYSLKDAIPLPDLLDHLNPRELLRPVDTCFAQYPPLEVSAAHEKKIRNGVQVPTEAPDGTYRVYGENGQHFLMLGQVTDHCLITIKSFFEVN